MSFIYIRKAISCTHKTLLYNLQFTHATDAHCHACVYHVSKASPYRQTSHTLHNPSESLSNFSITLLLLSVFLILLYFFGFW